MSISCWTPPDCAAPEQAVTLVPAGTITNAAKVLKSSGAREIYVCATHAVFSPPAIERLSSGIFQEASSSPLKALPS